MFAANDAEDGDLEANEVTLGIRGADSSKFTFMGGELKELQTHARRRARL